MRLSSRFAVIVLSLLIVADASAQYLGTKTTKCGNCTIPNNSCNNRPHGNQACSATNVGPETSWKSGTKINVYINTDSQQGFSSDKDRKAIEDAFKAWQSVSGVTFTFTLSSGSPKESSNYWIVQRGPTPSGQDGNTDWTFNTANGNILTSTTNILPTWTHTDSQLLQLMVHEIAHPMGLGDENEAACKGVSATYENGNTLTAPSSCDKTADQGLSCATSSGNSCTSGSGSGGGSGGGDGNYTCTGNSPNDTCECIGGAWSCDCSGTPPTCSDGTDAVCYNSSWTCGTVVTCEGTPPVCSSCDVAVCIADNEWQCQSF